MEKDDEKFFSTLFSEIRVIKRRKEKEMRSLSPSFICFLI